MFIVHILSTHNHSSIIKSSNLMYIPLLFDIFSYIFGVRNNKSCLLYLCVSVCIRYNDNNSIEWVVLSEFYLNRLRITAMMLKSYAISPLQLRLIWTFRSQPIHGYISNTSANFICEIWCTHTNINILKHKWFGERMRQLNLEWNQNAIDLPTRLSTLQFVHISTTQSIDIWA